ncbi:alpha/beta hydrolase [Nitratifractor sp.]
MTEIKFLLLIGFLLYLGAFSYLYMIQRSLLYHPSHRTPMKEGFFIDLKNARIWVERIERDNERAILYFPGNTEDYWIDPWRLAEMFPGVTIYFLHYPGYGASAGTPSQKAIYEAALALYDRVHSKHHQLISFGRSLGTSPALWLAANRPVDALILTTPFDSILHLGQRRYPLFPISLLLKDPYENIRYAPQVSCPTLILLAENDQVVPPSNSKKLISAFRRTVPEQVTLSGSDHTDIVDHPNYASVICNFLTRVLSKGSAPVHSRASASVRAKSTSTPESRSTV